jgi:hypothetical protein
MMKLLHYVESEHRAHQSALFGPCVEVIYQYKVTDACPQEYVNYASGLCGCEREGVSESAHQVRIEWGRGCCRPVACDCEAYDLSARLLRAAGPCLCISVGD